MEKVTTLSERLTQRLLEKGLSASDLAKFSGIDRSLISHYVHGNKYPKIENVRRMAAVLYVTPEWLEGYNVEKNPKPVQLSPLENDLIVDFRSCDAESKYIILEFVKSKRRDNGDPKME